MTLYRLYLGLEYDRNNIPLHFDPNGETPSDTLFGLLVDHVEAYTLTHGQGCWRSPEGRTIRERCAIVEVCADSSSATLDSLIAVANQYCARWNQGSALVAAIEAEARFITI